MVWTEHAPQLSGWLELLLPLTFLGLNLGFGFGFAWDSMINVVDFEGMLAVWRRIWARLDRPSSRRGKERVVLIDHDALSRWLRESQL